jgi:hypothetical protein
VTFDGYNKKIKLLDSSYEINKAYKGSVYPAGPGFKAGTYFHTEVMKGATQLMTHTSDFESTLGF